MKKLMRALSAVLMLSVIVTMLLCVTFNASAMGITIKLLTNEEISLEVEPTDRIEDVMQKISDLKGVPVERQILVYASKTLETGNTLQDYSIQKDSTVYLMFKDCDPHVFDADCTDATCNNYGCIYTREVAGVHNFTDCFDASCNNAGCSFTRDAYTAHSYTNCEDTVCDNEGCTVTRAALTHTFGAPASADDSNHRRVCFCGVEELEAHKYGEWTVSAKPTLSETGSRYKTCECGHTVTELIPQRQVPTWAVILSISVIALGITVGAIIIVRLFLQKKDKD